MWRGQFWYTPLIRTPRRSRPPGQGSLTMASPLVLDGSLRSVLIFGKRTPSRHRPWALFIETMLRSPRRLLGEHGKQTHGHLSPLFLRFGPFFSKPLRERCSKARNCLARALRSCVYWPGRPACCFRVGTQHKTRKTGERPGNPQLRRPGLNSRIAVPEPAGDRTSDQPPWQPGCLRHGDCAGWSLRPVSCLTQCPSRALPSQVRPGAPPPGPPAASQSPDHLPAVPPGWLFPSEFLVGFPASHPA